MRLTCKCWFLLQQNESRCFSFISPTYSYAWQSNWDMTKEEKRKTKVKTSVSLSLLSVVVFSALIVHFQRNMKQIVESLTTCAGLTSHSLFIKRLYKSNFSLKELRPSERIFNKSWGLFLKKTKQSEYLLQYHSQKYFTFYFPLSLKSSASVLLVTPCG